MAQIFVTIIAMLGTCSGVNAEYAGADIYTKVSAIAYSEAMPINQFLDNLEGPEPESGDVAFTFNQVEIGANYGRWQFGVFARFDYLLEFSGDSLNIAYADANNLDFPTGRQQHIELRPNHIEARGFGVGYQFSLPRQISINARINYLTADALTDGSLTGTLTGESEDSYEGDLRLEYYYEEDLILDRPIENISGAGFSIDVNAFWPINDKWSLSADFKDLHSAIYWDDVTYTEATATSNTVTFDEDGQLNAVAIFSGIESNRNYTQQLPIKSNLDVNYQLNSRWNFQAGYTEIESFHAFRLGWMAEFNSMAVSGGYQLETQAYELAIHHKYLNASVTTDSTDLDKAKLFGLSLSLNIPVW